MDRTKERSSLLGLRTWHSVLDRLEGPGRNGEGSCIDARSVAAGTFVEAWKELAQSVNCRQATRRESVFQPGPIRPIPSNRHVRRERPMRRARLAVSAVLAVLARTQMQMQMQMQREKHRYETARTPTTDLGSQPWVSGVAGEISQKRVLDRSGACKSRTRPRIETTVHRRLDRLFSLGDYWLQGRGGWKDRDGCFFPPKNVGRK